MKKIWTICGGTARQCMRIINEGLDVEVGAASEKPQTGRMVRQLER